MPAQPHRHQPRRQLVVGTEPSLAPRDHPADLFAGERVAVALGANDVDRTHEEAQVYCRPCAGLLLRSSRCMVAGGVVVSRGSTQPRRRRADLVDRQRACLHGGCGPPRGAGTRHPRRSPRRRRHQCGGARAARTRDAGDRRRRARGDSRAARRARPRARSRAEPAAGGPARHDQRAGGRRRGAGAGAAGAEGPMDPRPRLGPERLGRHRLADRRATGRRRAGPSRVPVARRRPRGVGEHGGAACRRPRRDGGRSRRRPRHPQRAGARQPGVLVDTAMGLVSRHIPAADVAARRAQLRLADDARRQARTDDGARRRRGLGRRRDVPRRGRRWHAEDAAVRDAAAAADRRDACRRRCSATPATC